MILTVTLNPAVDKTYVVPNFSLGKIHRPMECHSAAGGKGINVSRILRILGEDTLATGFLGGSSGDYIQDSLKKERIPSEFVRIQGETRTCLEIVDPKNGCNTKLNEPGPIITEAELNNFFSRYDELVRHCEIVVLSGSIPQGISGNIYSRLIKAARLSGVHAFLDTSGESLKEGIQARPYLLKPNLSEFSDLLGIHKPSLAQIAAAANKVGENGVKFIVISLGRAGSIVWHNGRCWHSSSPDVTKVSAVGSGDALLAGWAYALANEYPIEKAARIGSAAGAANAMNIHANAVTKLDIELLAKEGVVTEIEPEEIETADLPIEKLDFDSIGMK